MVQTSKYISLGGNNKVKLVDFSTDYDEMALEGPYGIDERNRLGNPAFNYHSGNPAQVYNDQGIFYYPMLAANRFQARSNF